MNKSFALIVEDDPDAATIFSEALQAAGFETEIIRSGDTALERLAVTTPDVVVLDLRLPHVSGPDILHRIRTDSRLTKTRIIVASAHSHIAETIRQEADLVLLKPISFSQLRALAAILDPARSSSN
ncbi:MAG: response regulator [Chloroflexota bacterium]|nr:response regulator [Chloroflexota bacterium]